MAGRNTDQITNHAIRKARFGRGGNSQDCRASQVVNQRNPCKAEESAAGTATKHNAGISENRTKQASQEIKIATWNVRSLFAAGKLDNVVSEMGRLKIEVLGLSDVQWPGSGKCSTRNGVMYYSGNDDPYHRYGVAIIVDKNTNKSVSDFIALSERVIMLKLHSKYTPVNIIQVYAPTTDKDEDEIEKFYDQIRSLLKTTKKHEVTIILGDLNAKVGQGEVEPCVGKYGLGERNERGDKLIEFCQSEDFIITNTMFKLPKRRLYTWKSPADGIDGKITRNQIDYVLIRHRFKNSVISAKTYPGADISSDHNPVVVKLRIRMKKIKRKIIKQNIDTKNLRDPNIYQNTKEKINEKLKKINTNESKYDIDERWEEIQNSLISVGREQLCPQKKAKQQWMTDEILQLMEKRRGYKNRDNTRYNEINRIIKKKIKEAREIWLNKKCQEIEEYEKKYDSFNVHRKVKEMTGFKRQQQANVLKDSSGNVITDIKQKLRRWVEYIEELFYDDRPEIDNMNIEDTGPKILREEVTYALKQTKDYKATGPDEVPIELLKLIDDETIDVLVDLYNNIYKTGIIPKQWLISTFVTIPKKNSAKECSEHRTIALMCHALKSFLRIIQNRIFKKLDLEINYTQFGFRNGTGTREALFSINVLMQRCLDMNHDIYACFIDFEKAFDKVQHQKLIDILKAKNIDSRDIRIISNLYWNQKVRVRIEQDVSENVRIMRGVRQGCVLSPLLFNVYSEAIFQEAILEKTEGIKINGEVVNNLRYADDTVIVAENLEDLQNLLEHLNETCEAYGIKMNFLKTKFMKITKKSEQNNVEQLTVSGTQIERVEQYKYLGTWITYNSDQNKEIRVRVEKARDTFVKMKKILCNRDLNIQLRLKLLKCYVFSTLLYGAEAWTLKQADIKKLQAFELWCYRRILKVSWVEHVSNTEILNRLHKQQEIIITIKKRKLEYLGHIMRGHRYSLLRLIMQGKIRGRRDVGRRRISWLRNLREWYGLSSSELFRAAVNKVKIAILISNLR